MRHGKTATEGYPVLGAPLNRPALRSLSPCHAIVPPSSHPLTERRPYRSAWCVTLLKASSSATASATAAASGVSGALAAPLPSPATTRARPRSRPISSTLSSPPAPPRFGCLRSLRLTPGVQSVSPPPSPPSRRSVPSRTEGMPQRPRSVPTSTTRLASETAVMVVVVGAVSAVVSVAAADAADAADAAATAAAITSGRTEASISSRSSLDRPAFWGISITRCCLSRSRCVMTATGLHLDASGFDFDVKVVSINKRYLTLATGTSSGYFLFSCSTMLCCRQTCGVRCQVQVDILNVSCSHFDVVRETSVRSMPATC